MRQAAYFVILALETLSYGSANLFDKFRRETDKSLDTFGAGGLCVIGCTPYVDFSNYKNGLQKYEALVEEMSEKCDVLIHVGDTKPAEMPCDKDVMTKSIHILKAAATKYKKLALYAPGDNELNDCHRHGSRPSPIPSDLLKAKDARQFLVDDLQLNDQTDLTGKYAVKNHYALKKRWLPGSATERYSCDFDKYVELNNYAVATLEVIGSHYYLDDERSAGFPNQNEIDPLKERLLMYLNANDCALDWIGRSAKRAYKKGLKAVFFMLHASFYGENGKKPLDSGNIGQYYKEENLREYIEELGIGENITKPYEPLFDKLTETAWQYPNIMFYVVHSDAHRFSTIRMNPGMHNRGFTRYYSHHNLMIHQVEGASRALTMYTRFTVDDESFQPVTLKQEWSRAAYDKVPLGHSWIPY